jgi:hypothetical protein
MYVCVYSYTCTCTYIHTYSCVHVHSSIQPPTPPFYRIADIFTHIHTHGTAALYKSRGEALRPQRAQHARTSRFAVFPRKEWFGTRQVKPQRQVWAQCGVPPIARCFRNCVNSGICEARFFLSPLCSHRRCVARLCVFVWF